MRKMLLVILIGSLALAALGCGNDKPLSQVIHTDKSSENPSEAAALTELSSTELARFKEIMTSALQSDTYLTTAIRQEFWALMDKLGPVTEADIATFKDTIVGPGLTYMQYFFTDALTALQTGQPYKSPERQQYEQRLIGLGVMTQYRLNQNESLMQSIATGQPVTLGGETGVVDAAIIQQGLENVAAGEARIELLLTPPY